MALDAAADAIVAASELVGLGEVKTQLLYSGAAGAILGATNKDPKSAAMWSAAAGGAMPFLGKEKVTAGSLALSIVTSTAIGLISNALVNYDRKDKLHEAMVKTCNCGDRIRV